MPKEFRFMVPSYVFLFVRGQQGSFLRRQVHAPDRRDGGNRVLIDDLLSAVTVQDHHKGVKARDDAPHLKAVHQEHGDRHLVPFGSKKKNVL